MPKMSLLPELTAFLRKNRSIYTVRKYEMARAVVGIRGMGECRRVPVMKVTAKEDLLPYVKSSGFLSVEKWWDKIRYFVPDKNSPLYLYKVEIID